jgi:prolipoprotein diacylglyceryl transferase
VIPVLSSIPSPPVGVWYLGPFPLRAYALAILAGIAVSLWITDRRYVARGGPPGTVLDIAYWAVPFGIIGGRIYHVISSPDAYFGPGGDPWLAFAIWNGGLGIWGAIALGAVGAVIGLRRRGLRAAPYFDAAAPALLVAQAIGRLGNWFNQELFGGPTTVPWGLEIDVAHLPSGYEAGTLFHPTFLYEMLWNLGAAALLVWLDRRFRFRHGRAFWAYVALYTAGRLWIEMLRIDPAELLFGLRVNIWVSILVLLGAVVAFVLVGRRTRGVADEVYLPGHVPAGDAATEAVGDGGAEGSR